MLDEFVPTQIFGEKWGWWEEPARVQLLVFSTDDISIVTSMGNETGEERLRRIDSSRHIPSPPAIFLALRKDRRGFPEVFQKRNNEDGKVRRFFCPGGLLQNPNGQKCEFYFWLNESGKFFFHALPMDAPRTKRDLSIVLTTTIVERPEFALGQRMPLNSNLS